MPTIRNPAGLPPPETYHHAIEVQGPTRTLYVSGQIGTAPDGSVPPGIEAQTRLVYANMKAVLAEAGMDVANVVKQTVFLTAPEHRPAFAAIRAEVFGAHKTASTLVYISGLVRPELLVEVEAVAVAPA